MASLREIGKKIEDTLPEIEAIGDEVELLAGQMAEGILALRTFATGNSGVKDIFGNTLTPYSPAYAKKREKAGLQTDVKDLIFKKDSSVIFSNIRLGIKDGHPVLGFVKEEGSKIAGYQEEQNVTKIFQLNDEERDQVKVAIREHTFKRLKEITAKWR